MSASTQTKNIGRITQIIGPVLDVTFPPGKMPNIYNAISVRGKNEAGQEISVTCEVQQLLGDHCVRAVAMSATDGLMRGMEVCDTGKPLSVPVGKATLGRIFNVLGQPIDNRGDVSSPDQTWPALRLHQHVDAPVDRLGPRQPRQFDRPDQWPVPAGGRRARHCRSRPGR